MGNSWADDFQKAVSEDKKTVKSILEIGEKITYMFPQLGKTIDWNIIANKMTTRQGIYPVNLIVEIYTIIINRFKQDEDFDKNTPFIKKQSLSNRIKKLHDTLELFNIDHEYMKIAEVETKPYILDEIEELENLLLKLTNEDKPKIKKMVVIQAHLVYIFKEMKFNRSSPLFQMNRVQLLVIANTLFWNNKANQKFKNSNSFFAALTTNRVTELPLDIEEEIKNHITTNSSAIKALRH